MEAVGGGLALIALGAMIASLIAIFRPIPSLWLPTRKRAALVCLGSLFLMGVAGSMLPPSPPAAASGAGENSDQPIGVASPKSSTLAAKAPSNTNNIDAQRSDFRAFSREFVREFDRCNNAFDPLSQEATSSSPNVYRLYSISENAKTVCRDVSLEIAQMKPPKSLDDAVRKDIEKVLQNCSLSAVAQQMTAQSAMKAIDNSFRPSLVSEMSENSDLALQQKLGCVAGWMAAAGKIGVETEDLFSK